VTAVFTIARHALLPGHGQHAQCRPRVVIGQGSESLTPRAVVNGVPDRSAGQRPAEDGAEPAQLVAVLPVHRDERGQAIQMHVAPEMVRSFAGRGDLGQGIVPPAGQEAHARHRQVVQAQEERAEPAFGLPQVGGVGVPRLGVTVQVEQAVGADQIGIELGVGDRPGALERGGGPGSVFQRLLEAPLPAAGARDRLQSVGHRLSITAGRALLLGTLGGAHGRVRPGPGQDVQALGHQPVETGALGPGQVAAVQRPACLIQRHADTTLAEVGVSQDPAQLATVSVRTRGQCLGGGRFGLREPARPQQRAGQREPESVRLVIGDLGDIADPG
jgi:hypothetical protein